MTEIINGVAMAVKYVHKNRTSSKLYHTTWYTIPWEKNISWLHLSISSFPFCARHNWLFTWWNVTEIHQHQPNAHHYILSVTCNTCFFMHLFHWVLYWMTLVFLCKEKHLHDSRTTKQFQMPPLLEHKTSKMAEWYCCFIVWNIKFGVCGHQCYWFNSANR